MLDGLGDVPHEGVEGLSVRSTRLTGKTSSVFFSSSVRNGDLVLGKEVAGAETELEGVAQVDGNGDVGGEAVGDGGLKGGLGGQDPRGAGEVDRHGVDVDAARWRSAATPTGPWGRGEVSLAASMKWVTASATKVPEPQAGSRTDWSRGSVTNLAHDGAGEPVRGVVLAELAALVGRNDGLVEDGRDVVGGLPPVEPGDAAAESREEGQAPPTSVGQAKKSDSTTPCRPVLLRKSRPRTRSAGSLAAKRTMSPPKRACTTMPMTAVK